MYKTLIIDDEKPVRDVIRALGRWEEMNVVSLYEAVEGESALQIMRQVAPEIVFVDMKMPNMNGADFLRAACREFPKTKYIVVSGFDDFEFTRQAIKSGVLDYLLKPVAEDELNDTLSRAVSELKSEDRRRLENMEADRTQSITVRMAREKIAASIIEGTGSIALMDEYKRVLGFDSEKTSYGLLLIKLSNHDESPDSFCSVDINSSYITIINIIDEMFSSWSMGFSFRNSIYKNEIIVFLAVPSAGERELGVKATAYMTGIVRKLESLFQIDVIACMGKFVPEIDLIREAYLAAVEIMNNVNVLESGKCIFTGSSEAAVPQRESLIDKKELLVYAFESGSMEYAGRIIRDYFDNIRKNGYLSLEGLHRTTLEFMIILENIIEKTNTKDEALGDLLKYGKETAAGFNRLEDLSEFVYKAFVCFFDKLKTNKKAVDKSYLCEIRDYIEKNYSSDIKLSCFADKYFISKEYLSRQFRDEFGFGIYEYVQKVRMERAKAMILDANIRIQSVSESLGYKDNNYFSRAFKNFYGLSPTEYRERILKK